MSRQKRRFIDDAITWRISRPFSSTSSLGPHSEIASIPLLKGIVSETVDENSDQHDDTKHSSLTRGQHERYLRLEADTNKSRWTANQRREHRTLQAQVKAEQRLYRQSRQKYVQEHLERFMAGFPSSGYATWHSSYTRKYYDHWEAKGMPLTFGKVRQIVSISQYSATGWIPSEHFESKVVDGDCEDRPAQTLESSTILPAMRPPDVPQFLRDDDVAIKLATKFGATVVVSADVLEHVLTLDSWKCALWNREDGIRILEVPLPQPVLPRRCLEKGIESSLQLDGSLYTLLTIKSSSKVQQVLIRGRRVSPRVHIEYFAELGLEELSSHDKACWILDSIMEPLATMQLVRVSAKDWKTQARESISVAHAMASGNDVVTPWNRLLSLFGSLDSMPIDGDYLLVCRGLSVALHQANDKSIEIDLGTVKETADAVNTSPAALLACARRWKWGDEDRVEDTFPIKNP